MPRSDRAVQNSLSLKAILLRSRPKRPARRRFDCPPLAARCRSNVPNPLADSERVARGRCWLRSNLLPHVASSGGEGLSARSKRAAERTPLVGSNLAARGLTGQLAVDSIARAFATRLLMVLHALAALHERSRGRLWLWHPRSARGLNGLLAVARNAFVSASRRTGGLLVLTNVASARSANLHDSVGSQAAIH